MTPNEIGEVLRRERYRRHLSAREVAFDLDLNDVTVYANENNKSDGISKTAIAMLDYYGYELKVERKNEPMDWKQALEVLGTYDMSDDNEDEEFKQAVAIAMSSIRFIGAIVHPQEGRQ